MSRGEEELIKDIISLKDEIKTFLSESYLKITNNDLDIKQASLTVLYLAIQNNTIDYSRSVFKIILKYQLEYDKKFSYGKNSTKNRNFSLQLLVEEFLNVINELTNEDQLKSLDYNNNISDYTKENKLNYILNNIENIRINNAKLILALSCIDNIINASKLLFTFNDKEIKFYFICVNTHLDIDGSSTMGFISNYNKELIGINNFFERKNIRNLTIFNPSRKLYLLLLKAYNPGRHHYIGHGERGKIEKSEKDHLMFRSKSKITAIDIASAYIGKTGEFIFLNTCHSSIIAEDLKDLCFINTLGYFFLGGGLDIKEAVFFSEEFFLKFKPSILKNGFLGLVEQIKKNLMKNHLLGCKGQILNFNGYKSYKR